MNLQSSIINKVLVVGLLLLASGFARAEIPDAYVNDPPSVHGMLLFGQGETYLSHLPMFHHPHDYQVLLQVQLDSNARATYLADQANSVNKGIYYTFAPERFVLPKIVKEKKCFSGSLYRGHFERGGIVLVKSAQACIENVLDFEKLAPSGARPTQWTGLVFGAGTNSWLVHKISARPDFDQVIHVERPSSATDLELVTIDIANEKPIEFEKAMTAKTMTGTEQLQNVQSLYLEKGDLE